MTLTRAYISWFDGRQGVAVDYLDNQIEFDITEVFSESINYLQPGTLVVIEEDDYSKFVALPEDSFNEWEQEQKEMTKEDTNVLELDIE